MTALNSWIFGDSYAVLRAAWTAMDQTYGTTTAGQSLQYIDAWSLTNTPGKLNFPSRAAPWDYDSNWTIVKSIDAPMNGKFVVYENKNTHQAMIVAMGTNGNSDLAGWLSNAQSYGQSQWTPGVEQAVFSAANQALQDAGGSQLIVAGDSKGGALAQFIVNSLVRDRAAALSGQPSPLSGDTNLTALTNNNIALISRVGPGAEAQLGSWVETSQNDPLFQGIQAFYSAPEMADGSAIEVVSQLGGAYLDGTNSNGSSNFYQNYLKVAQTAFDYQYNGHGALATYTYLHRLGYSGYDAAYFNNRTFDSLVTGAINTTKGSITTADIQALGNIFSTLGQGPTVSNAEAALRLGTTVLAGLALSPLAAIRSLMRGAPSRGEIGTAAAVMLLPGVEEALLVAAGATALIQNTPNFFHALADLWNKAFKSSASNGTSGADLYSAAANSSGLTLTDAQNNTITSSTSGSGTTITFGNAGSSSSSNSETIQVTSTDDGTALSTINWSNGDEHGQETFNAGGGGKSTYWFATGGYAVTIDDGHGNVETDYYSKAGWLDAWNFVHADGTSGNGASFGTGQTLVPTSNTDTPTSDYETDVNADGSYQVSSWDATDTAASTSYDANGNQTASSSNVAGTGVDYDRNPADTTTKVSTNPAGTITQVFDPLGKLESDTWNSSSDSSSGFDIFHKSGASSGKTINVGGSSDTYTLYTSGVGAPQTFIASPLVSYTVAGSYDLTRDHYDSDNILTGDDWQLADGTKGSDTFSSDGSGSGSIQHADGYTGTLTIDGSHNITINTSNSAGKQVSQDWWHADGTYGITVYNLADNTKQSYTYQTNGLVLEQDYDSSGTITYSGTDLAGNVFNPDGSGFGKIVNKDGSYSVAYYDSNGDNLIFNFNGSTLIGTDHVGSLKDTSGFSIQFRNGETGDSPYNGFTPVVQDGSTTRTLYADANGNITGDSWTNSADGSYGFDTTNTNGSSDGSYYYGNGTYYTYTDDGAGDKTTDYFDATGTETGDAWADADGSNGGDNLYADGSSSGTINNADGTRDTYTDDGKGDSFDNSFNSSGVKVADSWSNANGTSGTDSFAANGSEQKYVVQADGEYSLDAVDPNGNGLTKVYAYSGALEGESQLLTNGVGSVTLNFDASGNGLTVSSTTADGTTQTDSLGTAGAGLQANLVVSSDDGASLSTGSSGGAVVAWGNNSTITVGGTSALVEAWGSGDQITGGAGNDTLAAFGANSTLVGGTGNAIFEVNDASEVVQVPTGGASDTIFASVSYVLPDTIDVLTLIGSHDLSATGNDDAANIITGNSGNDTLTAGSGNDTLISGTGIDTLVGGSGIDTFDVNNSSDVIQIPYYNGYQDTINSSVDYVLTAPVYTLTLTGSDDLTATDSFGYATVTGNAGNDTLIGSNNGFDELVAGSGIDTLIGRNGETTFVINNAADVIEIQGSQQYDTVESSVSYVLGDQLDTLQLIGSDDLVGQGNDDASNQITGNSGNDTLIAGSGSDTLVAGSGTDTLIAGSGADLLQGNSGDTFVLGSSVTSTEISVASGSATIDFGAGVTAADLTLGMTFGSDGDLALLIQDGSMAVTVDVGLTGSIGQFDFSDGSQLGLEQLLRAGHTESATLTGSSGNAILDINDSDSITGGTGADTIIAAGSNDTITAGVGNQALYGLGDGDMVMGGFGDDTLHGGTSASTLVAGTGNTIIYGGSGSNSYALTKGGTTTIYPTADSGIQSIYLPSGMTAADFTSYAGYNGDLILQSVTGDTTAIISGFYANTASSALWVLSDTSGGSQFLQQWAAAPHQPTGETYEQQIDQLRQQYAARLGVVLNDIGAKGGTVGNPNGQSYADQYTFNGVSTQNIQVQGGQLAVGPSDSTSFNAVTTNLGTRTVSYTVPIYGTVTYPGSISFVGINDPVLRNLENNDETGDPVYQNGQLVGYNFVMLPQTDVQQVGSKIVTETYAVTSTYTTSTQSMTAYNIVGDGGDDVITAAGPFVGAVKTGDGNVSVDLNSPATGYFRDYQSPDQLPLGAFIEAGAGNDTISGTGGADTIAAGLGFDYLSGSLGTDFYVPMEGDSTEFVSDLDSLSYGDSSYQRSTLVLPTGITPSDIQYHLYQPVGYQKPDPSLIPAVDPSGLEYLQLKYGDSSVIVPFWTGTPSAYLDNGNPGQPFSDPNASPGVNYFQFADGEILTRTQLLAMAGAPESMGDLNPVVTSSNPTLTSGTPVAAASLFSASDGAGNDTTWYQITDPGTGGGHFDLNGTVEAAGQTFQISADQLSGLLYVPGASDVDDQVQVAAFDGVVWGQATTIDLTATSSNQFNATGPNQSIEGGTVGPDTLVGGYAGDTLVGASGQDTFEYAPGSGAETIVETAPKSATSDNVLQFTGGITPASVTLGLSADGSLVLSSGNGDSVSVSGFDPNDPLNSNPLQGFEFSDGSTLSLLQLLNSTQVTGSSGMVTNPDGSTTQYQFTPGADQVYSAQTDSASGQLLKTFSLEKDGTFQSEAFGYDSNGNLTSENMVNPDGSTASYTYNAGGELTSADITNTDGSTSNSTWSYAADGSYTDTVVSASAGGTNATTTVYAYDTQGNFLSQDVHNPDGSTADYTYDVQGRLTSADIRNADGSTTDSTYTYQSDGTYSVAVATTTAGGATTNNEYAFDSQGHLLSDSVRNPDGSHADYTYTVQGQLLTADTTGADGSSNDSTYSYNADGSYSDVVITTPAGGTATTVAYNFDSQGHLLQEDVTNPDHSSADYTYNVSGQLTSANQTAADGSTTASSYLYNSDGSYSDTVVTTPAGQAPTTVVYQYDAQGHLLGDNVQNPDSSTAAYTYNVQGQLTSADITNPDGSTNDSTYSYASDGSYTDTVVSTPKAGSATTTVYSYDSAGHLVAQNLTNPDGSTASYGYDGQGRLTNANLTGADGSTSNSTFSYNADGSYSDSVVTTPAGSGLSTTTVYGYDSSSHLLSENVQNPDGSSASYTYDVQGQITSADVVNSDGSTTDSTFAYNSDGSYNETVVDTPAQGASTTAVYEFDSHGSLQADNSYTPASDGSYTDNWQNQDGSYGSYWWNASTREYQENWHNSDGSTWSDDYQYAAGGSPAGAGVSFLESYTASDGSHGTRQFDATSGVADVSWYSSATGTLTGTDTDSGFIGLKNDSELTNTLPDPTFFNPAVSPDFQAFLAAH